MRPPPEDAARAAADGGPRDGGPWLHPRLRDTLALASALLLWELAARLWPSPALPTPSAVAQAAVRLSGEGLLDDVLASLGRVGIGYMLASSAALTLGAGAALTGGAGEAALGALQTLRPIPPIAWVPLAILWFGLGDPSAWFIVFVGAFFPILIQVSWALRSCPEGWLELSRSLGASPWLTLTRVRLPAALPRVATGLRTGLGLAWTSVVAAELVGAQSGLGYLIQTRRMLLDPEGVLVGMVAIGVLGAGMDAVAARVEAAALRRWGP